MRAPSAAELMDAWERCAGRGSPERALELVSLQNPLRPEALTPGARDDMLIDLRESLFGPVLEGMADCPACSEALEFSFRAEEVRVEPPDAESGEATSSFDGREIRFRLPTAVDVVDACRAPGVDAARSLLLDRCLLDHKPDDLSADAIAQIEGRMAELDPQAGIEIALTCPACGTDWSLPFDIESFLWAELEGWATRTARDVHTLASAYGWSEAEILALGRRRLLYLELVES